MPMHTVIHQRRRELGLTQEQVADHLGVTAPAVSKWESGVTCPDIGLLPPLARLLKLDLNALFCFQEELTTEEISGFSRELARRAQEDIADAFSLARAKLREFPHSEELLLNAALLLDAMLLRSPLPGNEKEPFEEEIAAWSARLMASGDSKIGAAASYMAVNRCLRQDKLDQAQAVLDTIQDRRELTNPLPDKLMLQVSIHLRQNKAELAALELERALYPALNRVQLLLSRLAEAEYAAGERETAVSIAEQALGLAELLGLWKYTGYLPQFQLAASEQDGQQTLSLLEQMLRALRVPWDPGSSPLFYRMAPELRLTDTQEMLSILLQELKTDPQCQYLRDTQGFAELLELYQ